MTKKSNPSVPLLPLSSENPDHRSDTPKPVEIGGRKNGPEPTRYGDWEKDGKCVDF